MLPTSHLAPISQLAGPAALADAFAEFSQTAESLRRSYESLQTEVIQLRQTLAERNQALRSSLMENAEIKLALEQILDSLPCGVLVVDECHKITLINPEARRLLAIGAEEIPEWNGILALSQDGLRQAVWDSSSGEEEVEFCIPQSPGKRWLAMRRTMLRPSNQPNRRVLILRDVTGQKQLEEEREAARNAVALAEVSAILAHEIRNPLASLELFAGLIGESSPESASYVSHFRAGIRSLSATVNNVLSFHGGTSLQRRALVLGESLRVAVDFVRPLGEERNIELLFSDSSAGAAILGDSNALQQVFLNLALNAFQHTPPGGRLEVSLRLHKFAADTSVRVEFSDSGRGIPKEMQSRIFDAGFSGSKQTPGLGLAVCRRVIEQHGATITFRSEPARGTTFRLEFPLES